MGLKNKPLKNLDLTYDAEEYQEGLES